MLKSRFKINYVVIIFMIFIFSSCSSKLNNDTQPNSTQNTSNLFKDSNSNEITSVIYDSCNFDINGDKKQEEISLLKNNDDILLLKINNEYRSLYNLKDSILTFSEQPKIHVIDNEHKYILVSIVWSVNKVGTAVQAWIYNQESDSISNIFDIQGDKKQISYYSEKNSNKQFTIKIPELNISKKIDKNDENKNLIVKQGIFNLTLPIEYDLKDYDKDGTTELITKQYFMADLSWLKDSLITVYKFEGKNIRPAHFELS